MEEKRVKTKKVVKRRLKLKGVLFLLLFFALFFLVVNYLLKVEIKHIGVTGNTYAKDSAIIASSELTEDVSFLGFSDNKTCEKINSNPLIKSCKIVRKLGFKVEIKVEENVPLFYYVNENSTVLSNGDRIDGTNTFGLPRLINNVTEKVLEEFVDRLSDIKSDIIHSISEIEYAPSASEDGKLIDEERFMMIMNDGNTVYINNKKMNILNSYDKIYASIGEEKGTFNFDCDFDNYLFTRYEEGV